MTQRALFTQRGLALPLAVFALVLVGALVSGAFFVGRQEQSLGRNSVKLQQAFAAAEAGAQRAVAEWPPDRYNGLLVGGAAPLNGSLGSAGWYRGEIRRLNPELFLVRSEGFSRDSTARQQVGLLVRLRPLAITVTAALAVADAAGVPQSIADGTDSPPPGRDCPAVGAPIPNLGPAPDSLLAALGVPSFTDLSHLATVRVSGGTLTLEPVAPGRFPIIWSDTSLTLLGGEGQGVLLVNGDLEVRSGLRFSGPVIVRGQLRVTSADVVLRGGVIAHSARLSAGVSPGAAPVRYSRCALDLALSGSATAALLRERSWLNMY